MNKHMQQVSDLGSVIGFEGCWYTQYKSQLTKEYQSEMLPGEATGQV